MLDKLLPQGGEAQCHGARTYLYMHTVNKTCFPEATSMTKSVDIIAYEHDGLCSLSMRVQLHLYICMGGVAQWCGRP